MAISVIGYYVDLTGKDNTGETAVPDECYHSNQRRLSQARIDPSSAPLPSRAERTRSPRLNAITVIITPNSPIPIEATPMARRNDGLSELGHTVTISPKMKMAKPVMASSTQAILNRTLPCLII